MKIIRLAVLTGLAMAFVGMSGKAEAQTYSCSDSTYGGSGSYATYASYCGLTNNQASSVVTSTAVLKTAAAQSAGLISNRITNAASSQGVRLSHNGFSASTSGIAAGDHNNPWGAWAAGSWSDVEDDNTDTAFDGDVFTVMGGVDYRLNGQTMIGLAIGYEDIDIDTAYNAFGGNNGNLDGDGYTIAPYISHAITDHARLALVVGYSDVEYDTLRYDPNTGNAITGSTDADRYFIDASASANYLLSDRWRLLGKAGIFYVNEDKDGFTETEAVTGNTITQASYDADLGQFLLDARIGYLAGAVEPYALIGGEFDFTKDEANVGAGQNQASLDDEDFGAKFGGGVNLTLGEQVTGGFEVYTVEFRDDYNEVTGTANLRIKF